MSKYTYNPADLSTSELYQARRIIGDVDVSAKADSAHFADEEIEFAISEHGTVTEACIELLEQLSNLYADKASVAAQGQRIDLSKISDNYAKRAEKLRERAGVDGGIVDMATRKVDGYSDDVDADDVDALGSGNSFDRPYWGNGL